MDARLGYSESAIANVALEKSRRVTADSPFQPVSFHALSRPHRFTIAWHLPCAPFEISAETPPRLGISQYREYSGRSRLEAFRHPRQAYVFHGTSSMENPMAASIGILIGRFALHLRPDAQTLSGYPSFRNGVCGGERRGVPPRSPGLDRRLAAPPVAIPLQRF